MREKRAKEQKQSDTLPNGLPKSLPIEKVLSTSITMAKNCMPLWSSETQLCYMTHYDFMCYDMDDELTHLVSKPANTPVQAVKFSPLVGQSPMRVVYLFKREIEIDDENEDEVSPGDMEFVFMVLPSLAFSEELFCKRIKIPKREIEHIETFSYFPDGQYVVFLALFTDNTMSLVYMGLATTTLIYYDVVTNSYLDDNQIGSLFHVSATLKSFKNIYEEEEESKELKMFKNSYLSATKEINEYVLVSNKTIFLLQLFYGEKEFKLVSTCKIEDANKNNIMKENNSEEFKPSEDSAVMNLNKTYLILRQGFILLLYLVDEAVVRFCSEFNCNEDGLMNEVCSFSVSFNSNRIMLCTEDKNCIYQYSVDEVKLKIKYVTTINLDLENQEGSKLKVILSEGGRNAAILVTNKFNKIDVITKLNIFKVELYAELDIPEVSLYFKTMKYQNRVRKVHRLVLPKIHEQLYALTGSEIHTLECYKMSGVMFFDIHPCGFYMAICYAFNIKIYSLEYNSMTLLHSTSLQNLKKVIYSPDGAYMIFFSTRKIKILNSYSFEQIFEFQEKANSIMEICFAPRRKTFITILDNGIISERSLLDFEKVSIYRIYGNAHHKVVSLKIDERSENLYVLLDDGGVIVKYLSEFAGQEKCYYYEDEEKISEIHIDDKNFIIFIGTRNGILRVHDVSIHPFDIEKYSEVHIAHSEITAITTSVLENCIFVGSSNGDITKLRYVPFNDVTIMRRNTRLLKKTHEKISPYLNFGFMLVSAAKFHGNAELNSLEDKLQSIYERIQHHNTTFKEELSKTYEETEKEYREHEMLENRLAYRDLDSKSKKLKYEIVIIKEKLQKNKKELEEQYEGKLRGIYEVQKHLQTQKTSFETKFTENRRNLLKTNRKEIEALVCELESQMESNEFHVKKEEFVEENKDLDEEYRVADGQVFEDIRRSVNEELEIVRNKCKELTKSNSYLETATINMRSRRVQEETLEHRIHQELNGLSELNAKQQDKVEVLSEELKMTEDVIHRIQNKVKNRKNNEISSDKADSDMCSYKLWMKEKVQEELTELEEYLASLESDFDKKSRDMVNVLTKIKATNSSIEEMKTKKEELRQKLKRTKDIKVVLKNQEININKNADPEVLITDLGDVEESQNLQIKKIISMERLNERAIFGEKKQMKIHERKVKNLNLNNSELLNEYEKLRFENKWLSDRRKECILELQKLRQLFDRNGTKHKGVRSERNSLELRDTPFQKYVKNRASRTKRSMNLNFLETNANTAASSRISSPVATPLMRTSFKFF